MPTNRLVPRDVRRVRLAMTSPTRDEARRIGRVQTVIWGLALALAVALLLFAATVLLKFPCVGVADNLDYWRVMRPAGISQVPPPPAPGDFVRCRFEVGPADLSNGISSAAVLAWLARPLRFSAALVGPNRMDLRQMGLVYLLVTSVVVLSAFARGPSRPLLVAGWLYVLVDPGFLLFFNSFFADSALLVALFGTCVWLLGAPQESHSLGTGAVTWHVRRSISLLLLTVMGGAAKMLYILLPCTVLVAVGSLRPTSGRGTSVARITVTLALLAAAVGIPWLFFAGPAPRFLMVNNYHAVFAGLVPVSSHPESVLRALSLPKEYSELPRTDIWSGHVPLDHPVFDRLSSLSRWKLLSLYLTDGAALRATAARISMELGAQATHPQRTFARESGRRQPPSEQYAVAWQFSRLHARVFGTSPMTLWVVVAIGAVWLARSAIHGAWDGHHAAGLLLLLFALSQFVVVILGDGFVALRQHLLGARLAVDMLLIVLVHEGVASAVARLALHK